MRYLLIELTFRPYYWLKIGVFFLVGIQNISAQSISDSIINDTHSPTFNFYENVYIHTDRDYYFAGDDVWFKAYLFDAQRKTPTITSNNLYVELISPSSIISSKIVRLDAGTGNGSFTLSETSETGIWYIRAYTLWMQNFKDNFVFEKKLHVTGEKKNNKFSISTTNNRDYIGFFPESGHSIQGVRSFIAFKAYDKNGNGLNVDGYIISSKGDTICKVKSDHLGMGKFRLCYDQGITYNFNGFINHVFYKAMLPQSQKEGYVLEVPTVDTEYLIVLIKTNPTTIGTENRQKVILSFSNQNRVLYNTEIDIEALQTSLKFFKKNLPEGITTMTLYDENMLPKAERLFFTEKRDTSQLAIQLNKRQYAPRDKIELSIYHRKDTISSMEEASLSLSVTDANFIPEGVSDIKSYLYLESELKGKIENPKKYFDTTNTERHKQLDLLLLTQGWRSYVWHEIKDSAYAIKYPMEKGFSISGVVSNKFNSKPLNHVYLTLFLPQDSQYVFYSSKSDSLGRFKFSGLKIYKKQLMKLSLLNENRKKKGCLHVSEPIKFVPRFIAQEDNNIASKQDSSLVLIANDRKKMQGKYSLSDTIRLDEITIKANRARRINDSMEVSKPIKIYDLKVKPEDSTYYSLKHYILNNIPEATIRPYEIEESHVKNNLQFDELKCGSVYTLFLSSIPGISKEQTGTVDEHEYDYYLSMSMKNVNRVKVKKFWEFNYGANQDFYFYLVSISLKPEAFNSCSSYSTLINGYDIERVFYSPEYTGNEDRSKHDLRPTICWNPQIKMDKQGQTKVTFYTSDVKGNFRIDLQGLTKEGKPIAIEGFYKVE